MKDDKYRGNRNDARRPYGDRNSYGDRRSDNGERRPYGEKRHDSRKPYGENRFDGPGRRTYGDRPRDDGFRGNAPRVGRVYDDVPRAQRVTGEPHKPRFEGPSGGKFHRGSAWRSESGPRMPKPQTAQYDYEPPEIPEDLAAEFTDVAEDERVLAGRNPIREALKAGRPVEKLLVAEGDMSGAGREIVRMAKAAGAVVQTVDRSRLDQIYPAHQGMLAYVAAADYTPLEDIIEAAKAKGEDAFVIVLDGVTDPHNLGAIIRSAECAGAHGVVIPERRSAGLTPAAAKAAAGALSHMPVARVGNLNRAVEQLKAAGLWIVGADMGGEDAFTADLTGPVALVIGSEGEGISRLMLENCDRRVSLPVKGHIDSLNASVAAGVLMYEIVRQRAK